MHDAFTSPSSARVTMLPRPTIALVHCFRDVVARVLFSLINKCQPAGVSYRFGLSVLNVLNAHLLWCCCLRVSVCMCRAKRRSKFYDFFRFSANVYNTKWNSIKKELTPYVRS